jgi:hypothetical protein
MAIEKDPRKIALIVAGGPSAAVMRTLRVNKREIAVIAVNGALDWLPFFDYWFTLDPTKVNRKRMRTFRHNGKYFIAFPKGHILIPSYVTRLERYSVPSLPDGEEAVGKLACAIGLSDAPNTVNSGNSAFGALGLAYHLGFEKVGLIGVDASTEERVDGGFSRDLSHLPALFESAMHQIDLVNCGAMESQIPKMSIREFATGVPCLSTKILAQHGIDAAQGHLANQRARAEELTIAHMTVGEYPQVIEPCIVPADTKPRYDPVTLTPLKNNDSHSPNAGSAHGDLLLHQNVGVRKESPTTQLTLSRLTSAV